MSSFPSSGLLTTIPEERNSVSGGANTDTNLSLDEGISIVVDPGRSPGGVAAGERTPLITPSYRKRQHSETPSMDERYKVSSLLPSEDKWYENIYAMAFIVYALSLAVAVSFYSSVYGWPVTTSLLAATSTLFGPVYNIPIPDDDTLAGNTFTLLLFAWGQSIGLFCISTAVGALVAQAPEIAARERRKLQVIPEDADGDGEIGLWDYWAYWKSNFLVRIGHEDHKLRYQIALCTIAWAGVGIAYGLYYEEWDFNTSLYFTLSTLTEMGLAVPSCFNAEGENVTSDCQYGDFRGVFLSIYIAVGVPLFAVCVAQFAGVVIQRAVRKHEIDILHTPLSEEEYQFAANFYGDDEVLNLGEFTILELLRLQRVSMEDLEQIKELFCVIDETATGAVDKPMLARRNLMSGYDVDVRASRGAVEGAGGEESGARARTGAEATPGVEMLETIANRTVSNASSGSGFSSGSAPELDLVTDLPNIPSPFPRRRGRSNTHTNSFANSPPSSHGRRRSNSNPRTPSLDNDGERPPLPLPLSGSIYGHGHSHSHGHLHRHLHGHGHVHGHSHIHGHGPSSPGSEAGGSDDDYVPLAIRRMSISEYNDVVVRHAIDIFLPHEGDEEQQVEKEKEVEGEEMDVLQPSYGTTSV